ncbi:MAG: radical SAM protein [Candidatus Moranbacteria bacterium]|nr:radical SAM protein [Candidatus Moranbacteria bacterium]
MTKRKNVVWNLTKLCPFGCTFCCVSATYVKGFKQVFSVNDDTPVIESELSFNKQLQVIDQLDAEKFRIDFSGGDVLINPRNIDLIILASEKFGAENIGLSIPGTFTTPNNLSKLTGRINDVEITMDTTPDINYSYRPLNYAEHASDAIARLVDAGFFVGVQTVLRRENMFKETIKRLHKHLLLLGVKKWSFLKFAPVGRGYSKCENHPSDEEYRKFSDVIKHVTLNSMIEVHYQYLMPLSPARDFYCRAIKDSIGIAPDGTVSSCFWAFNQNGKPFDDVVLGKVPEDNILDILKSEKAREWLSYGKTKNYCPLKKILRGGVI